MCKSIWFHAAVSLVGLGVTTSAAIAQQAPPYFELFGYSIFGQMKPDLTLPADAQLQLPETSAALTLELDFQHATTAGSKQRQLPERHASNVTAPFRTSKRPAVFDPAERAAPAPTPVPPSTASGCSHGCTGSAEVAQPEPTLQPAVPVFQSPVPEIPMGPEAPNPVESTPVTTPFEAPGALEFFGATRLDRDQPIRAATRPQIVNRPGVSR